MDEMTETVLDDEAVGEVADTPSNEDETAAIEKTADETDDLWDEDDPENEDDEKTAVDYDAIARSDLLELKSEFPELMHLGDLTGLRDPLRYGALRDLGLSPREAYLATSAPVSHAPDNRAHLHSAVPRAIVGEGQMPISHRDLRVARELFSDLSDTEIRKLYKKVNA